jgi:sensor histidine kinase YesM
MKEVKNLNRYIKYRLYGYPVIAVLLYLLFILINPLDGFFESYSSYQFKDYLIELCYLTLFTIPTIETGIGTTRILDLFLNWKDKIFKRILFQLVLQLILLTTSFIFLIKIASFIAPWFATPIEELHIRQAIVLGLLVSICITAFFTAEHFLLEWNNAQLNSTLLEKRALEAELAALRTQIDPHFLFNNFSTLTALIEDDKETAINYLERLTSVYRYLLTHRNKSLATVFDESLFAHAYIYLYQVRYGKNFNVIIDIHPDSLQKRIPPLTLQLLIENAVKHNTISVSEPLSIKVFQLDNQSLIVENNLNPKTIKEESTGLGLENINQRYKLLGFENGIMVNNTQHTFQVIIPLIKNEN